MCRDLRCGKLVCEYPSHKPFVIENAAIIYARVHNQWCVTLDYMRGPRIKDPFLVHDGTGCGQNKICMGQKCVDKSIITLTCDAQKNCNSKGVCNNKGHCHCEKGWAPPDCTRTVRGGPGGSIDSAFRAGGAAGQSQGVPIKTRNWLLVTFLLFLPATVGSVLLLVKLREFYLGKWVEEREEEDDEDEGTTEGESEIERSQETYPSETETASV
ncbi:hypothetical protein lerEdw1_012704 [Lerista edwardsae]|nr:hypothetical protein lerEdw1_012704 [Lerista edwardsae]